MKKKQRRMASVLMRNMWRCEIEKKDEFESLNLMKRRKRLSIEFMIMIDLDIELGSIRRSLRRNEKRRRSDDQDHDRSQKRFQKQLNQDHLCRNQEILHEIPKIPKRAIGQDLQSTSMCQAVLNHLEEKCMKRNLRSLRKTKNNEIILTISSENLRLILISTPEDQTHIALKLNL